MDHNMFSNPIFVLWIQHKQMKMKWKCKKFDQLELVYLCLQDICSNRFSPNPFSRNRIRTHAISKLFEFWKVQMLHGCVPPPPAPPESFSETMGVCELSPELTELSTEGDCLASCPLVAFASFVQASTLCWREPPDWHAQTNTHRHTHGIVKCK